jgi:hypothetical protein
VCAVNSSSFLPIHRCRNGLHHCFMSRTNVYVGVYYFRGLHTYSELITLKFNRQAA